METDMTEESLEYLGGLTLLAFAVFSMTPTFWNFVAWLGSSY